MLATLLVVVLSLTPACLGWDWGKSGKWDHKQGLSYYGEKTTINYTTIPGFFQQDDPATDPKSFDYVWPNFEAASQ